MRQNPWTLVWFLLRISINKDKAVEDLPKHHLPEHSFSARVQG